VNSHSEIANNNYLETEQCKFSKKYYTRRSCGVCREDPEVEVILEATRDQITVANDNPGNQQRRMEKNSLAENVH
jgi:hypothetical protein